MSNYYVSGCVADGDEVSTCDDSVAQFWTLYRRNEEGLSEGIIDCMFREDAEAAMRVYKERDALAALTEPAADLAELVPEEMPRQYQNGWPLGHSDEATGWNACRAEMLRKIEEAK